MVVVKASVADVPSKGLSILGRRSPEVDVQVRRRTPALFTSLNAEGVADKELSALLATDRVIPVAHGTTFEAIRDVSPLLAARSGLSTGESSLEDVAAKIAETVRV